MAKGFVVVNYVVISCKVNTIWLVAFANSGATISTYGGMSMIS
jgi:hypothetical protein